MATSEKKHRWADRLIAITVPLFPALLGYFQILNADIGFHVATGRAIDRLHGIPTTNVLSFAQPNHPWVLHQWIPAWLFHNIESALGTNYLVVAKCLILYFTFLFFWLALTTRTRHRGLALLYFVVAAWASASRFYVRPFLFSMLALSIILYLLSRYEKRPSRRTMALIVGIVGLFAALHTGIIYSLLVVLAFSTAGLVAHLRQLRLALDRVILLLLSIAAAGVVTTIESPWGIQALTLPFRFSTNEYFHQHLAEFRPLPFDLSMYPSAWLLLASSPVLLVTHILRHRHLLRTNRMELMAVLFESFCLLGFSALVLKHLRIVYPFALVSSTISIRHADRLLSPAMRGRRWVILLTAVAIATGLVAADRQFTHARFGQGVDERFYPGAAFKFVDDHDLTGPAYVSDGWGGHWLWRYYPTRKVFYDNRLEAYSFEFYHDVYQAIRYGNPGWQEQLDEYGINLILMKYTSAGERSFQRGEPNLRELALLSPDWHLVYWDDLGEVFVRASTATDQCRDCTVFKFYNPDTMRPVAGVPLSAVGRELATAWKLLPSGRACYALSTLLLSQGHRVEGARILRQGLRKFPEHPLLLSAVKELE